MASVSRDEVKRRVIDYLSQNTYKSPIDESDDLGDDLNISKSWRKHFAYPLSRISTSYPGGLPIYKYEAENLDTVKEVIELTFKRAKGQE